MATVQTTCKTKSSENKTRPDLKKNYEVYDHSTSGTEDGRSLTESVFIQPGWTKGDEMVYTGRGLIFSSNSETLICVFSVLLLHEFQTITVAAFGDENRILRSRRTVTLQQQSRDGAAFGKHTFLPHDAGVTVPWGAVLCRSNSELPPPLAPVSPLLAGLALHLGLGCLKELTLKQASFSFFKGNVRNHSPSYRAQHILVNVLPALPPHHTLSQDGSPRLSWMCRGTPDTVEQMVEPGFRPRSA